MVRMPASMAKDQPKAHAKEAATETVDELLSETEQIRQRADVRGRGRRTLEQLQDEARNLGEKARSKMEYMNDAVRDAAATARDNGLPDAPRVPTDAISDSVMESLKTASEKLSAEISDLSDRVESVKDRVAESMQAAGGKAKDTVQAARGKAKETWYQSSEVAKNVSDREFCLPLPMDRICVRHVALVALPLVALVVLLVFRRRYPKKWKASVKKMQQPGMMLARDVPSGDGLKAKLQGAADRLEETVEYSKQRGSAKVDEVRSKYGHPENKKEQ